MSIEDVSYSSRVSIAQCVGGTVESTVYVVLPD